MHLSHEDTLLKTGRALCERYGIQVVCRGLECCTDGDTIYLPGLPEELPQELWQAMRGYLDHEAAHIVAGSDFKLAGRFIKKYGREAFGIFNALEDVRVETVLCGRYPGSAGNLDKGYEYALRGSDPQAELLWQIGTALYAIGRGRDYSMLSREAIEIAETFADVAKAASKAEDSKQTMRLAERVWLELNKLLPPQNMSVDSTQNKGADPGQRAENDSAGNSAKGKSKTTAQPADAQSTSDATAAQPGKAAAPQDGDAAPDGDGAGISVAEAIRAAGVMGGLGGLISRAVNSIAKGGRAYRAYSTREDIFLTAPNGDSGAARALRQQASTVCAGISQKLLLCLQSQRNSRWLGDQESGSIDPAALHRLTTSAQPRVFRRRSKVQAINTAVTLLIDQSRSMNGERIHLAMLTALAFTESLERLAIPVSVEGFSTADSNTEIQLLRHKLEQGDPEIVLGLRMVPLVHTRFKSFAEPLRVALPRFASERVHELTPLGESLLQSARLLCERPEKRRLLFCLTDGKPIAGVGDEGITFRHARRSEERL